MRLVKKTAEYRIYARKDGRHAVTDADKRPINGEDKVKILLAEGLVKAPEPKPAEPEPEAATEEAAATEAAAEEPTEEAAEEKSEE